MENGKLVQKENPNAATITSIIVKARGPLGQSLAQATDTTLGISYSFFRFLEGPDLNVPAGWLISFAKPIGRAPIAVVGEAAGNYRDNVCAFARRLNGRWALAAAPRLVTRLVTGPEQAPVGAGVWQDAVLIAPGLDLQQHFRNIFTGETIAPLEWNGRPALPLARVFAHFPVALLLAQD